ncbi:DUF2059 domain-containing protein [Xanthobacter autotrophicus DSM 431]|uniref:DUF2059 domain-containing protein n=1 Tax=Xanthobacter nonsaccharivorans TaxID=3119912 RepID=UPI00372670FB
MRFMFKMVVVAALLAPAAAVADEASDKAALARQVVELSVAPGLDGRIARMVGEAAAKQPADKQAQARTDFAKAATGPREELIKVFSTYYAGAFSVAELKDLVAFYTSPLGRKAVKVENEKPAEVNAAIQQQIMKIVGALGAGR